MSQHCHYYSESLIRGDWKQWPPLALAIVCLFFSILFCPRVTAATHDYLATPGGDETFNPSEIRIYIPDAVELIRGVYFYVDPYNGDSRYITADEDFRTLVTGKQFALMGAKLSNVDMESGIGDGILRALAAFSQLSGHAELAYTNIYFEGYSWGGQFSYHFTKWMPERVVGFVTQKGGYHDTSPAGLAIGVPGYMFIGELDLPYRLENLTEIFEAHRPLGAVWVLALQPGAAHERITDRKLLDAYFESVVDLRLPQSFPPDQAVHLLPVDETLGWLGNRITHEIGSFDCYNAEVGQASWLTKRPIAVRWQFFVSADTVTDTIPCSLSSVAEETETRIVPPVNWINCSPNPFSQQTVIRFEIAQPGRFALEISDINGRQIRALSSRNFTSGDHEIIWNGTDASGCHLAHGFYLFRIKSYRNGAVSSSRLLLF